ncbi:MAG: glycerate kinase [Bacteroidetes bacterium HGW-Bacteroidetes-4]|jgi:glycerate kinase|nr:MAG: glycerate kinase [Bacteroidetes bacterium HGW-Bacteroidetes-4]
MIIPRFLIVPDSFKNCLTAQQAGTAIQQGILKVFPDTVVSVIPMADGGEGTVETILSVHGGEKVTVEVVDSFLRPHKAFLGILPNKKTAIIEMAAANGLELHKPKELNPWIASTYGTGLLIKKALDLGCNELIIGIGGSATNDGGVGMAKALGVKFLDKQGKDIGDGPGVFNKLYRIDTLNLDKRIATVRITVASDVTNTLIGPQGASFVYAHQKGADQGLVEKLDKHLGILSKQIKKDLNLDAAKIVGGGAAGGLGAGLVCFLGASIKSGFEVISEWVDLEQQIIKHDIVITAEGTFDYQSAYGKTPVGVATLARKNEKPVFLMAGNFSDEIPENLSKLFTALIPISKRPVNITEALLKASIWLEDAAQMLAKIIQGSLVVL